MPNLPSHEEQIRLAHADFIHQVVKACQNEEDKQALEPVLKIAIDSGWEDLVSKVQEVLKGRRDESLFSGLDEEDIVILKAILQGLQNPATLPELNKQADASLAAPGLAHMIHAASRGDAQSLQGVSFMAEQMVNAPGDLRLLGSIMHSLVNGERDPDVLCKGMSTSGEQLVLNLLDELNKLALQ